jgi:hypothetical protein
VSKETKRRFVTVVYEITDDVALRSSGNPLKYEHNGLKSVGISAGDLMGLSEEVAEHMNPNKYKELYSKHVMSSMPNA